MGRSIEELLRLLKVATPKFRKCEILPPGDYEFEILEAKLEYKTYEYVWVKFDCGTLLTQDQFPTGEDLGIQKFASLLIAVGIDKDAFPGFEKLIGKRGKLTAPPPTTNGKVYYRYQEPAK
jgi:hypothetical protein